MQLVVECDSFNKTQQQVHKKLKTLFGHKDKSPDFCTFTEFLTHIRAAFATSHLSVKTEKFELNGGGGKAKGVALPSKSVSAVMETVATADAIRVVIRPIRAKANYGMCLRTCK